MQCPSQLSLTIEPLQILQLWVMLLITTSLLELRQPTLILKFHQKVTDYLSNTNTNTIFLTQTDKNEISFKIASLDSQKSSGPNSIFLKNLNYWKMAFSTIKLYC